MSGVLYVPGHRVASGVKRKPLPGSSSDRGSPLVTGVEIRGIEPPGKFPPAARLLQPAPAATL